MYVYIIVKQAVCRNNFNNTFEKIKPINVGLERALNDVPILSNYVYSQQPFCMWPSLCGLTIT